MPAGAYLAQLGSDFVVHAWDLARGLGVDDRLDPAVVADVHARAIDELDALRASGMFGEQLEVADDADEQTRLLALVGRRG